MALGGSKETLRENFSDNGVKILKSYTWSSFLWQEVKIMIVLSSQFFIVQSDSTYLDGQYAVLGMFMKAWTLLIKFVKM